MRDGYEIIILSHFEKCPIRSRENDFRRPLRCICYQGFPILAKYNDDLTGDFVIGIIPSKSDALDIFRRNREFDAGAYIIETHVQTGGLPEGNKGLIRERSLDCRLFRFQRRRHGCVLDGCCRIIRI